MRFDGRSLVLAGFVAATVGACGPRHPLVAGGTLADRDAAADAPPAEASRDAAEGPDAGSDAAASVATYRSFVDERRKLQAARYEECFGVPADVSVKWRGFVYEWSTFDVGLGLAELDAAALDACLGAVAKASCVDIARGALDAACPAPFRGLVPPGGYCLSSIDCAGSGAYVCSHPPGPCASRCVPAPPEPPLGLPGDGEPCDANGCAGGDYCRPDGPHGTRGVCRPIAPGGACDGSWQCPFLYECVFKAGGGGACGAGLGEGAACRLYGFDADNGPKSDCAGGLYCYPDGSGVFRCQKGQATGQTCAEIAAPVAGQNGGPRPCRSFDDYCEPTTQLCAHRHATGEACAGDWACDMDGACEGGRGQSPVCVSTHDVLPAGAPCGSTIVGCGPGLDCGLDDPSDANAIATCKPLLADGQACPEGIGCGWTSDCIGGVCRSCLP